MAKDSTSQVSFLVSFGTVPKFAQAFEPASLKNVFSQPLGCENTRSVYKVTDFVDKHYILIVLRILPSIKSGHRRLYFEKPSG
jgi:hypothetical protein